MDIHFKFLALLLITRTVISFDCPSRYDSECDCQIGYEKQDNEMNCPGPLKNLFSRNPIFPFKYFKISFIPQNYVQVQCYELPDWLNFNYNISSEVKNSKQFILQNCTLKKNSDVSEIAKLTGAENSEVLRFERNYRTEFALSKNNLHGFPNVERLSISQNYKLSNLSDDLLEYLPKLTYINLSFNHLKMIPENLFQNVPKLTTLRLEENLIESIRPKTFQNLSKLKHLSLVRNKIVELKPHTFDDLIAMEILELQENKLRLLTNDIFRKLANLKVMNLMKNSLDSFPADLFEKNLNLSKINLQRNLLKTLPSGLFKNLNNIKEIYLAGNVLESLPEDLFRGLSKLENLNIGANRLQTLSEQIFNGLENLKMLNLNFNRLTTISSSLLSGLRALEEFNANDNYIKIIHGDAFGSLVKLSRVNLSNNKLSNLEKGRDSFLGPISVFSPCYALKQLHLSHNEISEIYADWITIPGHHFEFLDLSHNSLTGLSTNKLDFKHIKDIRLNLSNNKIRKVNLQGLETRFESEIRSHMSVDISNNPIVCDCSIYEFLRYLDRSMSEKVTSVLDIRIGNVRCTYPEEYKGTLLSNLNSVDFRCNARDYQLKDPCPELCSTKLNFYEETLIIDCANKNLTEVPEIICNIDGFDAIELNLRGNFLKEVPNLNREGLRKVKRLLLSGNNITRIPKDALSSKLEILELHDNDMTELTSVDINQVINSSIKNITLSENPWDCNCEARDFLNFVQNTELQVISDASRITCKRSKKPLKTITVNELCPVNRSQILCNISETEFIQFKEKTCKKPETNL